MREHSNTSRFWLRLGCYAATSAFRLHNEGMSAFPACGEAHVAPNPSRTMCDAKSWELSWIQGADLAKRRLDLRDVIVSKGSELGKGSFGSVFSGMVCIDGAWKPAAFKYIETAKANAAELGKRVISANNKDTVLPTPALTLPQCSSTFYSRAPERSSMPRLVQVGRRPPLCHCHGTGQAGNSTRLRLPQQGCAGGIPPFGSRTSGVRGCSCAVSCPRPRLRTLRREA